MRCKRNRDQAASIYTIGGGPKAASISNVPGNGRERERVYHSKKDKRECAKESGEHGAEVESELCFAHREPTLTHSLPRNSLNNSQKHVIHTPLLHARALRQPASQPNMGASHSKQDTEQVFYNPVPIQVSPQPPSISHHYHYTTPIHRSPPSSPPNSPTPPSHPKSPQLGTRSSTKASAPKSAPRPHASVGSATAATTMMMILVVATALAALTLCSAK